MEKYSHGLVLVWPHLVLMLTKSIRGKTVWTRERFIEERGRLGGTTKKKEKKKKDFSRPKP